jgi:sarcosine oxidase subunit alpha
MPLKRITKHPILEIPESKEVAFTWNGKKMTGYEGEMISAALFANGIHIFGHHPKDNSPQGMSLMAGRSKRV